MTSCPKGGCEHGVVHRRFSLEHTPSISCAQWGSEIQASLDFEWSKRGWVANGMDFD